MFHRVESVRIRSALPIGAAVHFFLGLLYVVIALVAKPLIPGPGTKITLGGPVNASFSDYPDLYVFVLWPFLSAVAGAVMWAAMAWLYNVLSRWVGPLQVSLRDANQ